MRARGGLAARVRVIRTSETRDAESPAGRKTAHGATAEAVATAGDVDRRHRQAGELMKSTFTYRALRPPRAMRTTRPRRRVARRTGLSAHLIGDTGGAAFAALFADRKRRGREEARMPRAARPCGPKVFRAVTDGRGRGEHDPPTPGWWRLSRPWMVEQFPALGACTPAYTSTSRRQTMTRTCTSTTAHAASPRRAWRRCAVGAVAALTLLAAALAQAAPDRNA